MSNMDLLAPVGCERRLGYEFAKRTIDVVLASLLLTLLSPLLLLIALAIRRSSRGPILFRQQRVGRGGVPFQILKFRSMVDHADAVGPQITSSDDSRVTRVGRVLRVTKLDELPQLVNVLRGEMSFVGPRPQVRRFVEQFQPQFRDLILSVRPGITGPTQLEYRHEEEMLEGLVDREGYYIEHLLPVKCALDVAYVRHRSLACDARVFGDTLVVFFRGNYLRLRHRVATAAPRAAVVAGTSLEHEEQAEPVR